MTATNDPTHQDNLRAALERWAMGESWSRAFGLTRQGFRNWQRDDHLRAAFNLCGRNYNDLARAALRFESTVWPRWRTLPAPPASATPINRELFLARLAAPFPNSTRQFGRILQKTLVDVMPSKLSMELATMTDLLSIECYLRDKVRAEQVELQV